MITRILITVGPSEIGDVELEAQGYDVNASLEQYCRIFESKIREYYGRAMITVSPSYCPGSTRIASEPFSDIEETECQDVLETVAEDVLTGLVGNWAVKV